MTNLQDQVARDAARLLMEQSVEHIGAAITAARHAAGAVGPPPSRGRVRRHLVAMQQQSMGAEDWARQQQGILASIEECMVGLGWAIDDLELRLAGRAAEGHVDGIEPIWMRLHAGIDDGDLCLVLEEQEFEITSVDSIQTRHGRMTRIAAESGDFDLVLLRCPHRAQVMEERNLITGAPVVLLDAASLARRLAGGVSDPPGSPPGEDG